jgi:hypothetical protein
MNIFSRLARLSPAERACHMTPAEKAPDIRYRMEGAISTWNPAMCRPQKITRSRKSVRISRS